MTQGDKKEKKEYISLTRAAGIYGCTPEHLNLMVRSGKLKANKVGRNWFTTIEWLDEYKEKNLKFKKQYISLFKASEIYGTTQPHLNLMVRQGRLKAVKMGRNWVTTIEWLEKYKRGLEIQKRRREIKNKIVKKLKPVFNPHTLIFVKRVTLGVLLFLFLAGFVGTTYVGFKEGTISKDQNTNKVLNSLFNKSFTSLNLFLTSSGNFAMNVIYSSYNETSNLVKNIPTFVSNTIRSISFVPSNIKKQVVSLFPLFSPFSSYSSFDSQTIVSIKDIYSKLNNLRDYMSGKTILVHEQSRDIVREITIIQPKQTIETTIKSAISLDCALASGGGYLAQADFLA